MGYAQPRGTDRVGGSRPPAGLCDWGRPRATPLRARLAHWGCGVRRALSTLSGANPPAGTVTAGSSTTTDRARRSAFQLVARRAHGEGADPSIALTERPRLSPPGAFPLSVPASGETRFACTTSRGPPCAGVRCPSPCRRARRGAQGGPSRPSGRVRGGGRRRHMRVLPQCPSLVVLHGLCSNRARRGATERRALPVPGRAKWQEPRPSGFLPAGQTGARRGRTR
jgi:hypothetical protein